MDAELVGKIVIDLEQPALESFHGPGSRVGSDSAAPWVANARVEQRLTMFSNVLSSLRRRSVPLRQRNTLQCRQRPKRTASIVKKGSPHT